MSYQFISFCIWSMQFVATTKLLDYCLQCVFANLQFFLLMQETKSHINLFRTIQFFFMFMSATAMQN